MTATLTIRDDLLKRLPDLGAVIVEWPDAGPRIEFLGSKAYAPSVAVRLQADFPDVAMRVVPVRLEIDGHLFDAEHPPLPEPTYPFDDDEADGDEKGGAA